MKLTCEQLIDYIAPIIGCNINELNFESGIGTNPYWDSLSHVAIMAKLEKDYDITINEDNIDKLLCIKDILDYINKE